MARVILMVVLAVAVVTLLIYGAVWLYQTHVEAALEERRMEHERRMADDERNFDQLTDLLVDEADDEERR